MSRYIDADRAIESLFDYCIGKKTIGQCIDDTPTAEVKPIVYGEWIKHSCYDKVLICSNCNRGSNGFDKNYNFCPNCGATMRKEKTE